MSMNDRKTKAKLLHRFTDKQYKPRLIVKDAKPCFLLLTTIFESLFLSPSPDRMPYYFFYGWLDS